jgi:hypothetical protein
MSGNGHEKDRLLDEAAAALRDAAVPDGPTPALKQATLSALKRPNLLDYESTTSRRQTMRLAIKVAAVVVLSCGVFAYVYLRAPARPKPAVVATPPPPLATRPATRPEPPPRSIQPLDTDIRHDVRPAQPDRIEVVTGGASIRGTVHFAGPAPEPQQIDMAAVKECAAQHPGGAFEEGLVVNDGKLANVVVWVKFAEGQAPPAAAALTAPAVLDQKGCQYRPHVLAMMAGQPLLVSNSDGFLHNVHALSIDNPAFNVGQPSRDPGRNVGVMKAPEVFKVKCDVHPWMGAFVHVIEHPFFAVTREDGSYAIPAGLPDGTYTIVAWHEKLGEKTAPVVVNGGRAEGADFTFSPQAQ